MDSCLSCVAFCLISMALSPAVLAQSSGFHDSDNHVEHQKESWLKQNNRFIFILVIGFVLIVILGFYIVKSIRGMQKRLARENEKQMHMIQKINGRCPHYSFSETLAVSSGGYDYKHPNAVNTVASTDPVHSYQHRY